MKMKPIKKLTKDEHEKLKEAMRVVGKKGGTKTLKKYGSAHFKKIAEMRWGKTKKKK